MTTHRKFAKVDMQCVCKGFHNDLGKPSREKSEVFLNIVQKAFGPPPFYLNICPILQGVFFERVFEHLI